MEHSADLEFKSTSIENTNPGGVPLINFICPEKRDDIPLNKDWSKRNWTISSYFPKYVKKTLNFEIQNDDIWILGQQKTGKTWLQEIIWLITNNFDFEKAMNTNIYDRTENLE